MHKGERVWKTGSVAEHLKTLSRSSIGAIMPPDVRELVQDVLGIGVHIITCDSGNNHFANCTGDGKSIAAPLPCLTWEAPKSTFVFLETCAPELHIPVEVRNPSRGR